MPATITPHCVPDYHCRGKTLSGTGPAAFEDALARTSNDPAWVDIDILLAGSLFSACRAAMWPQDNGFYFVCTSVNPFALKSLQSGYLVVA